MRALAGAAGLVPHLAADFVERFDHMACYGFMVTDTSRGRVSLAPDGSALLTYRLNDADRRRVLRGYGLLARLLLAAGAETVHTGVRGYGRLASLDAVARFEREAPGTVAAMYEQMGGSVLYVGKPHAPMLDFAVQHTRAQRPIFVGDRIDTDIKGGNRAGMPTLLVFTGAHGKRDLLAAGPGDRPNYIGADLRALLEPARTATQEGHSWRCGAARAQLHDGRIRLEGDLATGAGQFDALWALANLVWATDADPADALALLDRLH